MFLIPEVAADSSGAFLIVAAVMVVCGLASTLPPLVQAMRIDPGVALRYE